MFPLMFLVIEFALPASLACDFDLFSLEAFFDQLSWLEWSTVLFLAMLPDSDLYSSDIYLDTLDLELLLEDTDDIDDSGLPLTLWLFSCVGFTLKYSSANSCLHLIRFLGDTTNILLHKARIIGFIGCFCTNCLHWVVNLHFALTWKGYRCVVSETITTPMAQTSALDGSYNVLKASGGR